MRSIVRRDTGESYKQFLTDLAKASGIETPTRKDLTRLDRKRKNRTSNQEWKSPTDPDARVAKMKDGRTHLAHKAEYAVDLDSGAGVAVTLQAADLGDTTTIEETLADAGLAEAELVEREAELYPEEEPKVNVDGIEELVADKDYHSGAALAQVKALEVRTYIPEKKQAGKRHWKGFDELDEGRLAALVQALRPLAQQSKEAKRRVIAFDTSGTIEDECSTGSFIGKAYAPPAA
jgi:transposase